MPSANVRRRGTGDPEATFEPRIGESPKGLEPVGDSSAGPAKVSSFLRCLVTPQAFADPRLA